VVNNYNEVVNKVVCNCTCPCGYGITDIEKVWDWSLIPQGVTLQAGSTITEQLWDNTAGAWVGGAVTFTYQADGSWWNSYTTAFQWNTDFTWTGVVIGHDYIIAYSYALNFNGAFPESIDTTNEAVNNVLMTNTVPAPTLPAPT
jgi:hypothetical protein